MKVLSWAQELSLCPFLLLYFKGLKRLVLFVVIICYYCDYCAFSVGGVS